MVQYLEIAGTAVGLVYLYLEYKASIWLWLTGIIMPAIYIYVYYSAGFYADMGINVYYLFAGLYGWAVWMGRGGMKKRDPAKKKKGPPRISHTPIMYYIPLLLAAGVFYSVILFILLNYTDSTVPYGDSFTTALSIIGLWMLSRKYAEQWLVWLLVDVVCCGLYVYKGLYFTSGLYGLYSVIAVFGYFKWLKLMKQEYD